jgi:hypothetical protein
MSVSRKIALLIDCDNVSHNSIEGVLEELAKIRHGKRAVDAFALMTSDSDFTPLVLRILESGLPVYGFGEKKTPQSFVDSCSLFIFTENLSLEQEEKADAPAQPAKKNNNELRKDTALVKLLRTAAEQTSEDGGSSFMV